MSHSFPLQILRSGRKIEIPNAARSSRWVMATGIGIAAPIAMFFTVDKGVFFFLLPVGLIAFLFVANSLFAWDVVRTVIDPEGQVVNVTSARSIGRREKSKAVPFREFSFAMVEFSMPKISTSSPGTISLTLTGRREHVEVFSWHFYGEGDHVRQSFMPPMREIAGEIAEVMGLRLVTDISPLTTHSTGPAAKSAAGR